MFNEYRASPASWRPSVKQRARARSNGSPSAQSPSPVSPAAGPESGAASAQASHSGHRSAIITYPFPLREGVLASIELPDDLTRREARRLSAFIESLAIDTELEEQADLTSGISE
jgi:hypothetical protein